MRRRETSRFHNRIFLIFLIGLLAGVAAVYVRRQSLLLESDFLKESVFRQVSEAVPNVRRMFLYCLWERLMPAGCLVGAAWMGAGVLAVLVWLLWCGFGCGMILTVLSARYGMQGCILFLGGILPQAALLIPAYVRLMEWCVRFSGTQNTRSVWTVWAGRFLWILLLLTGGCVLECVINPSLMKILVRII